MANLDAPRGLVPLRNPAGTASEITHMTVDGAYATDIYPGMILKWVDNGTVEIWDGTATDATVLVGVAAEKVTAPSGTTVTDDVTVAVYSDPNQEFVVQESANSLSAITDFAGAFVGLTGDIDAANTTLGYCKGEIDGSTATNAYAAAVPLRVWKIDGQVDNVMSESYTDFVVKFHPDAHFFAGGAGRL